MTGTTKRTANFLLWTARREYRFFRDRAGLAFAKLAFWAPIRYPDFLGIGAPRSATTWLHHWLSQHPDICMAKTKEIHFFDECKTEPFDYGIKVKRRRKSALDLNNTGNWRWYANFFRNCGSRVAGEITPNYSRISEERIGEIKRRIPRLKLIFLMRNPITRAWSSVRKELWRRYEMRPQEVPLEETLVQLAMQPTVLSWGDYQSTIENWEKHFAGQILYLFYDDVVASPSDVLGRVYDFLGVDRTRLRAASGQDDPVNDVPIDQIPVPVREALESHYAPTIRFLEERFDRSLAHWLSGTS